MVISKPMSNVDITASEEIDPYILLNELVYGRENILMSFYIFEGVWSVLFNPIAGQS